MGRYFIELSYNGSRYHGWQVQPNGDSVQAQLRATLGTLLQEDVYPVGCGRTDTGVHARRFFAHFDAERMQEKFLHAINGMLPKDISIHALYQAGAEAHARFSAESRVYRYYWAGHKSPFYNGMYWQVRKAVDIELMQAACGVLLRHEDFTALCKKDDSYEHYRCLMMGARIIKKGKYYVFEVEANRFLRGMVRIVVGTLMRVGQGMMSLEELDKMLSDKDRTKAAGAAPACGLYLWDVKYPEGMLHKI